MNVYVTELEKWVESGLSTIEIWRLVAEIYFSKWNIKFRENFFVDSLNQNSWKHVVNSLKDISSSVTYEIVSGDQNLFKINPETGEIKTIRGLDYEQQRMHFLTISTEEARGTFNLGTAK